MKLTKLIILILTLSTIISCNDKKTETPTPDITESMANMDISKDFNWSASIQGQLIVNLENPNNVSTELEYLQIINEIGIVIDHEIVYDNSAIFDVNLPADANFYIYFPVTTDKFKIEGLGSMTVELGNTVDYVYPSLKSTEVVSCTSCDNPLENVVLNCLIDLRVGVYIMKMLYLGGKQQLPIIKLKCGLVVFKEYLRKKEDNFLSLMQIKLQPCIKNYA